MRHGHNTFQKVSQKRSLRFYNGKQDVYYTECFQKANGRYFRNMFTANENTVRTIQFVIICLFRYDNIYLYYYYWANGKRVVFYLNFPSYFSFVAPIPRLIRPWWNTLQYCPHLQWNIHLNLLNNFVLPCQVPPTFYTFHPYVWSQLKIESFLYNGDCAYVLIHYLQVSFQASSLISWIGSKGSLIMRWKDFKLPLSGS